MRRPNTDPALRPAGSVQIYSGTRCRRCFELGLGGLDDPGRRAPASKCVGCGKRMCAPSTVDVPAGFVRRHAKSLCKGCYRAPKLPVRSTRAISAADRARVVELRRRELLPSRRIAELTGVSRAAIDRICSAEGLSLAGKRCGACGLKFFGPGRWRCVCVEKDWPG